MRSVTYDRPMRSFVMLVGVFAGCGGSLNRTSVRAAFGETLERDPALASAICGYAVAGLTAKDATDAYTGVDASEPRFRGAPVAHIRGVPIPAPGVPTSQSCEGDVEFGYFYKSTSYGGDRGNNSNGTIVKISSVINVVRRLTVPPAGLPSRYLYGTASFILPVANEQRGFPLRGHYIQAPGDAAERIVGDYEIVVPEGSSVKVKTQCDAGPNHTSVSPSGYAHPTMTVFRGDTQVANLLLGNNSDGDVFPNHPKDTLIEIVRNGGASDGFLLETPGTYRLRVKADCPYFLYLSPAPGPTGIAVTFTAKGNATFPARSTSAKVEVMGDVKYMARAYTVLGHLTGEQGALGSVEQLDDAVRAKVREVGGHAIVNYKAVTTPDGAVNRPRTRSEGDVIRWSGPNICYDNGTCSLD